MRLLPTSSGGGVSHLTGPGSPVRGAGRESRLDGEGIALLNLIYKEL